MKNEQTNRTLNVLKKPAIEAGLLKQIMEDLNIFAETFILDAKLGLLRSKLRLLHQTLDKGELKSLTRGLLTFISRWPKKKCWLRIGTIVKKYTELYKINSLNRFKILNAQRFISSEKILKILNSNKPLSIKIQ